jgi:hypothetical protein
MGIAIVVEDAEVMLIILALYVLANALLWGFGGAFYLVAKRARASLGRRSERYWRDRQ